MKPILADYTSNAPEIIRVPSDSLIGRFPIAASIAALEAAVASTKKLILCRCPSLQELINAVEQGETIPEHLFIVHNMIDNLEQLRVTIQAYFQHVDALCSKVEIDDLPF